MVAICPTNIKVNLLMFTKAFLKDVFKVATWLIGAWLIIGSIIFIGYPWYQAHRAYIRSTYNYKIQGIQFRPGHRGVPYVKLDTGWYLLRSNAELQIVPYIQVGDSVVKEKGSATIRVFRKNQGDWEVKVFD